MGLIEKAYFTLEEVEERWQMPRRDTAYLAENGMLRLSVRLFGARLECGQLERAENGQVFAVPFEQGWFDGLQDLSRADAHRLFRDGQVEIVYFDAPDGEYRCLIDGKALPVRTNDVVVRREERDRIEHDLRPGSGSGTNAQFHHTSDYAEIHFGGIAYRLGPLQAGVVRHLHGAALAGKPWCSGKLVLRAVGSASIRLADVFKSQRHWRQLIDSDGRGNYRLRSP